MYVYIYIYIYIYIYQIARRQGRRELGLVPLKNKNLDSPPRADRLNTYTLSERLTVSCRATWVWSGRVSFYNRRIGILPRKTKKSSIFWTRQHSGPPGSDKLYRLSSPLVGAAWRQIPEDRNLDTPLEHLTPYQTKQQCWVMCKFIRTSLGVALGVLARWSNLLQQSFLSLRNHYKWSPV
jgi:hypothetical protein